ncbi:MAG TPA: WecB/TagA/CpsF family glycosyltransferase, partial [Patescibacteria group bacterium]|nr:WecB/TagA/CpsF family glycosyltransferase [Patescibacteria group bacterium]
MINILGVDIDNQLTKEEIFLKINKFLDSDQAHYIVTPNPEIILKAQKDEELFHILNQADLSLADGFGLKLAALMSGKSLNRFTGADFVLDLLRIAQNRNKKVLIICNQNGLSSSEDISQALKEKYPQLRFLVQATDFYYQIDESNKKVAIRKCFRCNF